MPQKPDFVTTGYFLMYDLLTVAVQFRDRIVITAEGIEINSHEFYNESKSKISYEEFLYFYNYFHKPAPDVICTYAGIKYRVGSIDEFYKMKLKKIENPKDYKRYPEWYLPKTHTGLVWYKGKIYHLLTANAEDIQFNKWYEVQNLRRTIIDYVFGVYPLIPLHENH